MQLDLTEHEIDVIVDCLDTEASAQERAIDDDLLTEQSDKDFAEELRGLIAKLWTLKEQVI